MQRTSFKYYTIPNAIRKTMGTNYFPIMMWEDIKKDLKLGGRLRVDYIDFGFTMSL